MRTRILTTMLALTVLALPSAGPAAATGLGPVGDAGEFDAVVLVREADVPALLALGDLGEYALVSAAELGLDEAALAGLEARETDAVLPPAVLSAGAPAFTFGTAWPFVTTFPVTFAALVPTVTFRPAVVPVFAFRPVLFRPFVPFRFWGFWPWAPGRLLIVRTCC